MTPTTSSFSSKPWHAILRESASAAVLHRSRLLAAAQRGRHQEATSAIHAVIAQFGRAIQEQDPHVAESIAREFHAVVGPMKLHGSTVSFLESRVRMGDASWAWAAERRSPLFVTLNESAREALIELVDASMDSHSAYRAAGALTQRFADGPRDHLVIQACLLEAAQIVRQQVRDATARCACSLAFVEAAVMAAIDQAIDIHALRGPGLRLLARPLDS